MTDTPHDDFGDPTECDQSELLRNLKVEFRHVDQLKPWERNARTHSSKQVRQIAASITEFGYTLPLLIDEENRILAGHGRRLALTRLGIETVPVICIEGMTEAQKRAYVLADNKLAENACWDPEILSIELQHLVEIDAEFDVTVTGFETPEIDLIIEGVGVGGSDVEPETVPELDLSLPLVSTQGDLWFMGRHRLLCGDATTASDFEHLMDGARAEMVFIDPPYNVRIDGNVCGLGQTRHREFVMASGEMSETEFIKFLASVFVLLAANSTDGSVHYICIDWRHLFELLTAARGVYTETLNHCVWVKSNGGMGSLYRSQHEFVVVFKNGRARHVNNVQLGRHGRNRTNVWNYPGVNTIGSGRDQDLVMHPTVKPVAMVADAMLDCSNRGGIVLDCFAGSGTTIIAAEKVGRCAYAMDLDPIYVDTAVHRWQIYSGDQAIHAETGLTFDAIAAMRQYAAGTEKETGHV